MDKINFTGSEVIQSRFQEGRAFPNSDASIAFRFTNEGEADLDELKQILKNKPQYANDDLAVFNVVTKNEGEKGVTKKFLLNWKELTANEENANVFAFFGRKIKGLQVENSSNNETKAVTSHIYAEIKVAMNKLFQINESKTEHLSKRIEDLAKRLG